MSLSNSRTMRRWTREVRPTVTLALPIMAGMIAQTLIGLIDTMMVGRVGMVPLAAACFVTAIVHLPLVFALGLLSSVSVLTSQAFGARRAPDAGEVLRHGLILAAGTGILTVAALAALQPFLGYFGQPPEVAAASKTYLVLFGASMLPALIAQACKQFSESLNRPWAPTFILTGGVLLNVLLNWILIYGNWGAPALGLNGAGWATLIARSLMAVGLIVYVVRSPALQSFQPLCWRAPLRLAPLQRLISLGWPVAVQHLLEVSAFVLAALMMGWISTEAIAAHQIAITCAATTFMFGLGIGMAVSIRVGHAWGAGELTRVRRIGFVGLVLGAGTMSAFAVLFIFAGENIVRLFVAAPGVIALGGQLLLVAAIFQVADGAQIVAISGLRGMADVRVPALIAALAYWVIAVPLGYLLAFHTRLNAVGMWIGLATGLAVAACGLSWRFHRKSRVVVAMPHPETDSRAAKSVIVATEASI